MAIDDLDNHRLISFSSGEASAYGEADWFLIGKNGMRKPYMNVNSSLGLIQAAKLGLGVTCMGKEFLHEQKVDLVDLFPEDKGLKVDIFYTFYKNMKSIKRITSLGNFLKNRNN